MKVVKFDGVKAYNPPGHIDMAALKLQGKAETGLDAFWIGLSHFLPNGRAEWEGEENPKEKVYIVLEGELTVRTKDETTILKQWDSVFIMPNEGRELINETNRTTSILVIASNPK